MRLSNAGTLVALLAFLLPLSCDGEDDDGSTAPEPSDTVFVNANAGGPGTGTADDPYATIAQGILHEGVATVFVAEGTYEWPARLELGSAVQVQGASRMSTIVVAQEGGSEVDVGAHALGFLGLGLQGDLSIVGQGGLEARTLRLESGELTVEVSDVVLGDVQSVGVGISVLGADQIEIRDADLSGATLNLEEVTDGLLVSSQIADGVSYGLRLVNSVLAIEDLTVTDTIADPDPAPGVSAAGDGIALFASTASMVRVTVARSGDRAVAVGFGSELTAEELTLAGGGRGLLSVQSASSATVETGSFDTASLGVFVLESSVRLVDVDVTGASNSGVLTGAGAEIEVVNSFFEDNPNGHLAVQGEGSTGLIQGNIFLGTEFASCVAVSGTDARVEIVDNTIRSCAGQGISVLSAHDVVIRRNEISEVFADPVFTDVANGIGLVDASATIEGNTVLNTDQAGISLLRGYGSIAGNEIGPTGGAGIRIVDPSAEPALVDDNDVDQATGSGIVVLTCDAVVSNNRVSNTVFSTSEGLGDGITFGAGADVVVQGNTVTDNGTNGVLFLDGAQGSVLENTASGNQQFGVLEFCDDSLSPNDVEVRDNVYADNGRGDESLCP